MIFCQEMITDWKCMPQMYALDKLCEEKFVTSWKSVGIYHALHTNIKIVALQFVPTLF